MFTDLGPYGSYGEQQVGWLPPAPAHWTRARFRNVLRERDHRSASGDEQLLRVSQFTGVTERLHIGGEADTRAASLVGHKRIELDDLVVNIMLAWNGSLGVSRYEGIVSPAYCVYSFSAASDPWYYHCLLRTPEYRDRIKALSTGVVDSRLRLYTDDLYGLEALVPPIAEQAAIVKYLAHAHHRIDRAIAAKRKLIALLEEQKQAIINQAVTRGLDPTVPLKDTGILWLGAIPAHWSVKPIGAVSSLVQTGPFGSQLHAEDYVSGGVPVINPSHITGSSIHADRDISVAERTASRLSRHRFKVGDVVLARRGELGRCAVVGAEEAGWLCGTGSLIVRPDPEVDSRYLQVRVSSAATRAELDARSTGATMPNLNVQMISKLRIPVPPVSEQQRIVDALEREESAWRQTSRVIEAEIALLREFRTRLTSDVVTGLLDVRHIAATLSDAGPGEFDRDVSAMGDDLVDEVAEFLEDVDA